MRSILFLGLAVTGASRATHAQTAAQTSSQTDTIKLLKVRPSDNVTPVASYFVSTPVIGYTKPANDALPVDSAAPIVPPASPGFFPTDVTNPNNLPGIPTLQHHPVYVNKPASHWGNPARLLRDLGVSEVIHALDQYTGSTANNRYTLGTQYGLTYTIPSDHTIRLADIAAMIHAAATAGGSGTGHLYHLFLPQGVDVCTRPGNCYTPDNYATFTACAWHNYIVFYDIGPVVYTIEPYQDAPGCRTSPDHPVNGQLTDATDSALSHETFEAISDPVPAGWVVHNSPVVGGQEIADLCELQVLASDGNYYWSAQPTTLGTNQHVINAVYSNQIHACTYGEGGPTW